MTQFRSGVARLSVLALTAAVAAGCDTVGPDGTGNVQVTMQKIASATATQALVDGFASVAEGSYVPIDLNTVMSFTVEITSIDLLEDGADGNWISLDIVVDDLDLKTLPDGDLPLVIASGSVPGGGYQSIRLVVNDGMIVFNTDVSMGQIVFLEGMQYPVTVPSGVLKTDMPFTVVAGDPDVVNLFFDEGATFQNATTTGNDRVILTPVLRAELTLGEGGQ